jgi:hypothetical protein
MNKITYYTLGKIATFLFVFFLLAQSGFAQNQLSIYGYFSTRYEKQFETKNSIGVIDEASPSEWTYPFFNLMLQHQVNDNIKVFVNLNGADASNLDVRNFWGDYSFADYLSVRLGKIYRKFGLYNEILDAVPTYYGIEPPELFDGDHLLISRTTALMIHGDLPLSNDKFKYSVATDNGEGGSLKNVVPLQADLNFTFGDGNYTVGTSAYTSGGNAVPDKSVGEGSPKSGVLPWMDVDKFSIIGGYVQLQISNLLFQSEYWLSKHKATRNPSSVIELVQSAGLNSTQLSRFLIDPTIDPTELTDADVKTTADYDISTWYVKAGYSFFTSFGEIAPYLQWDYYSNPETIAKKSYGGDNEAGAADDGVFNKSTVGVVYRPVSELAIKLDQSFHFYKVDNQDVNYPEVRLDVSYIFGN